MPVLALVGRQAHKLSKGGFVQFIVNVSFLNNGTLYKEGEAIIVSQAEYEREKSKGKHPKTGKPISGLLNHCTDQDSVIDVGPQFSSDEIPVSNEMIVATRAEFKAIGAAYDRRWGLSKLEAELKKAKKERGL